MPGQKNYLTTKAQVASCPGQPPTIELCEVWITRVQRLFLDRTHFLPLNKTCPFSNIEYSPINTFSCSSGSSFLRSLQIAFRTVKYLLLPVITSSYSTSLSRSLLTTWPRIIITDPLLALVRTSKIYNLVPTTSTSSYNSYI